MNIKKEKILIIDDAKLNITILTAILEAKYDIITAKDGKAALEKAKEILPDLVLLDMVLPDIDGFELIKIFKNSDDLREIPIICITSLSNVEDEIKGLRLGAIDYIKKPFVAEIVNVRVDNQINLGRQRKLVEEIAQYDALTHIPNRRNFDAKMNQTMNYARENGTGFNIGYFDIDYFKQYNDNYGHAKGDDVLRLIASCALRIMNEYNGYVARVGGEEFCFILPYSDFKQSEKNADSLRIAIQSMGIEHKYSEVSDVLTVSVGGILLKKARDLTVEKIFKPVDDNLYKAKCWGRNCVVWGEI